MRVVVTRPAAESQAWCAALQHRGFDARPLPLIAIAPLGPAQADALQRAWAELGQYRAVMFVSAAAVRHFFGSAPAGARWPAGVRAWSPGPGTAAVLEAHGVPPSAIDAPPADAPQFDSEALWAAAGHGIAPGDAVLIVRGAQQDQDDPAGTGQGRAWMAERLAAAGATTCAVAAYRRGPPSWDAAQAQAAAALAHADTVWVFSNSEAIGHLFALLPHAAAAIGEGTALASHPRIAAAAQAFGFGRVMAVRPGIDALMQALGTLGPSIESTR